MNTGRNRSFLIALLLLAGALTAPATAAATGGISGNIADIDGDGVPYACARAFSTTNFNPNGAPAATAPTDQNGNYVIAGLDVGDYNVQFTDDSALCPSAGDFYLAQWYDGTDDPNAATPVSVADGATTPDIDAAMLEPRSIVGHVQNLDGAPLANICVVVNQAATPNASGPPPGFARRMPPVTMRSTCLLASTRCSSTTAASPATSASTSLSGTTTSRTSPRPT